MESSKSDPTIEKKKKLMMQCLEAIVQSNEAGAVEKGLGILLKLIKNICENPKNEEMRKLKLTNRSI